jgi:ribose transport system substrate-binding protein
MVAARATAARLGVNLEVLNAEMDPVLQSQQLLAFVQSRAERPDAIVVEPVNAAGLPRVAEAAVAADIAWVVSNARVDYIAALRRDAKVPVFVVSQDHVEVGRIQAWQIGAMLPDGGSVLYLRGESMNSLAQRRFEGLDGAKPKNVEVKSVKIQGSTEEKATHTVRAWLNLSTARAAAIQLIVAQNADFILGARNAFATNTAEWERNEWLALPCTCGGIPMQIKPLVDQRILRAAVFTPLTMDTALEMLIRSLTQQSQPPEITYVEVSSYPSLEELTEKRNP